MSCEIVAMQPEILIPYPSFRKSIACYTDIQLVRTLCSVFSVRSQIGHTNACKVCWTAHEQWLMWHNWEQAFVHFGLMCVDEAKGRELRYSNERAEQLRKMKKEGRWYKPYWVGWPRFHDEHRALLIHYGECELLAIRLIRWEIEKAPITKMPEEAFVQLWLESNGFPDLFQIDHCTLRQANHVLDNQGALPLNHDDYPNPYADLGQQAMDRRSIELPVPGEQIGESWSYTSTACSVREVHRARYPAHAGVTTGTSEPRRPDVIQSVPIPETPIPETPIPETPIPETPIS